MQQYPDIDRALIEAHIRLGYTQEELDYIIDALELNASTAGIKENAFEWIEWRNRGLAAIRRRFQSALNTGEYEALLVVGYTPNEIRDIHFTNLLSVTQVLARTESVYASKEYQRVYQFGYTDVDIRSLIRAGFTVSNIREVADRMNDAKRNGVDLQGLTFEQLDDLLFKKRSMNSVQTLGIVPALLSGIHSKMREGEVARCIIDYVTAFDVPYGLGGTHGQVDVGTQRTIIEAKVDRVRSRQYRQIHTFLNSDDVNPPDANGMRKFVILYAPGYDDDATVCIQAISGHVVKSCEELRKQIRELGGP